MPKSKKIHDFRRFLRENLVLLDGGFGTMLQTLLPEAGEFLSEEANLRFPETVEAIHRAYFDAGANVVCTDTFGVNGTKYSPEQAEKMVKSAVLSAEKAREESSGTQEKFVALDIGPTGRLLKPFGDLDFEEAVEAFAVTVRAGRDAGADLIFIETMTDCRETKAAVLAAKENADLPVLVANAFGSDGRMMTGSDPQTMVTLLEGLGVDAVGVNCSLGPKELLNIGKEYARIASLPVIFKPNAGLPVVREGRTEYDVGPAEFADTVMQAVDAGVGLAGGCCGTTPAHIAELAARLRNRKKTENTEKKAFSAVSSGSRTYVFREGSPAVIGERINPTGKKHLKETLLAHDLDFAAGEAERQAEAGADILDINVGIPGVDESSLLSETVERIQTVCELPVQIDSSDPKAMERALRRVCGKPLVNSVNGKRQVLDAVLPLVKKYGGTLVCLTLDESGIPDTCEGRLKIAKNIIDEAEKYGIGKENLIFDPLCLSIAADREAGWVTLSCVKRLREEYGVKTVLGVSNVSFGLPDRETVNGEFFGMALAAGLSAGIINPCSEKMQAALKSFSEKREAGIRLGELSREEYERFADRALTLPAAEKAQQIRTEDDPETRLKKAVIGGRRDEAAAMAGELLKNRTPLELIDGVLIPALDEVGVLYEKNKIFLPQLLASADSSAKAFEVLRKYSEERSEKSLKKGKFVLATVFGDIHDIGKNIVKMLLENYGFEVLDLGKNVPPETVLRAVKESGARLCGLSALMTTTVGAMEETIRLLKAEAPSVKICVGGAVLTPEYAEKIGAHRYAADAMETVRWAEKMTADENNEGKETQL